MERLPITDDKLIAVRIQHMRQRSGQVGTVRARSRENRLTTRRPPHPENELPGPLRIVADGERRSNRSE